MALLSRLLLLLLLPLGASSCTRWFFYPSQVMLLTPQELGYAYQDVWLSAADGATLHAWWLPAAKPSRGSIYFLHGNAENISTHLHSILWLVDSGYDALLLDYRGFGRSTGLPDIPDVFQDIDAGYDWLVSRGSASEPQADHALHVFGQSIGASLALIWLEQHRSAKRQIHSVVAEAAFTGYGDIARDLMKGHWLTWWAQWPAKWLLASRHDPIEAIASLEGLPKLIMHSREDQIIPYTHGEALYEAAAEPKVFVEASGPHIHSGRDRNTRRRVLEFLDAHSRRLGPDTSSTRLRPARRQLAPDRRRGGEYALSCH